MDATNEGAIIERLANAISPQAPQPQEEVKEPETAPETEQETVEESQPETEAEQEQQDDAETVEESLELSQFAEILGIDEDKLDLDEDGNVFVKTKIDGAEGKAKFQDLIKSYQLEGHLNKRTMEVAEQQKAMQQKLSEFEAQKSQQLQQIESLTRILTSELQREASQIDWQELRVTDPGEYAAKVAEFQQREAQIGKAVQALEEEKTSAMRGQQEQLRAHLANEDQKLMAAVDGWSDINRASKELGEVYSYLGGQYGYTDQDMRGRFDSAGNMVQPGITDHRLVLIARKAMLYDQLQQSKPAVTKKVVKAPKLVKPGIQVTRTEREKSSVDKLKQQIRKSGGKEGIEALLIRTGRV